MRERILMKNQAKIEISFEQLKAEAVVKYLGEQVVELRKYTNKG